MTVAVEITNEDQSQEISTTNDAALDLYFKIHDKVNARSEEISKSYKENILVSFEDVRELHHKILQSIKSLHPARDNLGIRISVSHKKGWTSIPYILLNHHIKTNVPFELGLDKSKRLETQTFIRLMS